jgi:DinB superfamily
MTPPAVDTGLIAVLAELARQVRDSTLKLLNVPEPAWLTWSPPGTSNHILWHVGHALWVQDVLCLQPLTGRSELPRDWDQSFGQHCRPVATTTKWPEEFEVRALLEAQLETILKQLAEHAETIAINANEPAADGGWPLLAGMIHAWHDEARHHGEMFLLHKLCRAREAH